MLALIVHLRLHYQLVFLSPLFAWGFVLGGATPSWRALVAFLAFHVFLYGGITAYNSYYDRDEGPVGGLRRPPPVTRDLLAFSIAVQAAGLGLALLVGPALALLYALAGALSVLYSHPRLRWKARPLLSLTIVAVGQGMVGYAGGWLVGNDPSAPLDRDGSLGLAVATLVTVGFYPLTQIYQMEEDRSRGDRTFAVEFGPSATFRFALACLTIASACMIPLVARRYGSGDALLVGLACTALLVHLALWARRFRADVGGNFVRLHLLQLAFSTGTLGYIGVRIALA